MVRKIGVLVILMLGLFYWKYSSSFTPNKTNLLLVSKNQVAVFSYEGKQSAIINFSPTERVLAARGFGEYELGKVYPLGELENKGGLLLTETFQNSLSLPVSGYLYFSNLDLENINEPGDFNRLLFSFFKKQFKTNLKIGDLAVLFFQTRKLSPLFFEKTLYNTGNKSLLFQDELVREEALTVEVLNATQQSGLAQKATDFWENLGGRVVRIDDYHGASSRTKLIVRGEAEKSYSYKMIKKYFNPECSFIHEETSRAEMSLILGEDYWKIMAEKW